MIRTRTKLLARLSPVAAALVCVGSVIGLSHAQSAPRDDEPAADQFDQRGRRVVYGEPTTLGFRSERVERILPFLVETTGKVVLPQPDVLNRPITVVNDRPISRELALDLVIFALQQNGVAVVETKDLIILRDLGELDRQDVPVLGPDVRLEGRTDYGTVVDKVFRLEYSAADTIGEVIKSNLPSFAKLTIDPLSNQIAVMANIGLLQQIERKVEYLDQPSAASLVTETFHLRYADAEQVATNIRDLFSQTARTGQGGQQQNPFQQFFQGGQRGGQQQQQGRGGQQQQGRGGQQGQDSAATSANLRVTANTQQNSVTVLAEKQVLEQIRTQINDSWDRQVDIDTLTPRIYTLVNSDPIKVRDAARELFGQPGAGSAATQSGVGRMYGQFSFEAIPESSRLVVLSKSAANFRVIDEFIAQVDQPLTTGLPRIVELKHASAEELAEQLNALLAQEGTLAQIPRQETGLSQGSTGASPFASDAASTAQAQTGTTPGTVSFWWQRARPPTATAGSSNLVSKVRIVPVWRQNALMVLSPPEYSQSVVDLISELDKPGRQVLLKAVIAEISLEDATAMGLRWSNAPINPTFGDNVISAGANSTGNQQGGVVTGTKNDLLPGLFDTSVLNVGVDLNVLFQALSQKTNVNILSEPRIFTSDNQEAEFFAGQDIPFITDSQTTDNGTLTQSFDYRAVGLSLRVRPRITPKRDVDLRINLELSSIQPNQTLFGGFIVDRRESTTHLIVQDGQTVVVSGILRSEDSDVRRKFPILGDIPLVGLLFQSTERIKAQTEIVAFITPIVIENPGETDAATESERERLNELREDLTPPKPIRKDGVRPSEPGASAAPAERPRRVPTHGYEP